MSSALAASASQSCMRKTPDLWYATAVNFNDSLVSQCSESAAAPLSTPAQRFIEGRRCLRSGILKAKSPKASLLCVVDPALCAASWRSLSPGQPPLPVIWTCTFLHEARKCNGSGFGASMPRLHLHSWADPPKGQPLNRRKGHPPRRRGREGPEGSSWRALERLQKDFAGIAFACNASIFPTGSRHSNPGRLCRDAPVL